MTTWSALVVDADPSSRQSLRLVLEADGARVLGVGTVASAVEAIGRAHFDVVVLDLALGASAIANLLGARRDIAIIAVTRAATLESAIEVMHFGACDYLPLPISPHELRDAVAHALERRLDVPVAEPAHPHDVTLGADISLEAVEREHIARVIARTSTLEAAARTLGIDASTLQRKRKRYGLT